MHFIRQEITDDAVEKAIAEILEKFKEARKKHGNGLPVSAHEIAGLLSEEYLEFVESLRTDSKSLVKAELLDLVVIGLLGIIKLSQ